MLKNEAPRIFRFFFFFQNKINLATVTPEVEIARSKSKIRIKFKSLIIEQRSASVKAHRRTHFLISDWSRARRPITVFILNMNRAI